MILLPLSALLLSSLPVASTSTTGGESSALVAALDAIEDNRLRSDLAWIAADERGGRDTPSEGLEETARYIVKRLEALGFSHGARDGYLHRYPLKWKELDRGASQLLVQAGDEAIRLRFGEEYYFGRSSALADLVAQGEVVSISEGDRSDFRKADLRGKWAWCFDSGSSPRRVADRAEEAGAVGVVFTPGPGYDREDYAERLGKVMGFLGRGVLGRHDPTFEGERPFPSVYVTRDAARRVLEAAGVSQAEKKPAGTALPLTIRETRRLTHPKGFRLFENVAGLWKGSDPELASEVIVVSAHYDHVGERSDKVYNGADDNGSGTTGLLGLAQALEAYGPMRRSVLLLWVSAEEKGLYGSEAWTKRPWLPEGMYPVANINIDMIGRNATDELLITPTKRLDAYNGLTKLAEKLGRDEGFRTFRSADAYWRRSDHMNFADHLSLPVAFLFADVHEDYHKATDTPDKIDYDKLRRASRLVMRMLDGLQADKLELDDKPVPSEAEFRAKVLQGMARTDLEILRSMVELYAVLAGDYPETIDDLTDDRDETPFPPSLPRDPWGNEYSYSYELATSPVPRLTSWGSDGVPGGEDLAEDIILQ